MKIEKRTNCRLCNSEQLELVCPLKPTPVAEQYADSAELSREVPVVPLDLYRCGDCGHVQVIDIVDASYIFDATYTYRTGQTAAIIEHFHGYAEDAWSRYSLSSGDLVVEIGSNDGTLLKQFKQHGAEVLGVDPASTIAKEANDRGIETIVDFFTATRASQILTEKGSAKLVVANNVFAHADDLQGIADGVSSLLADDGLFMFEVSYLLDVLDKCLLGTIFHEHVSYHALAPMCEFLKKHGMEAIHVQRNNIQGGSIIVTAKKAGGPQPVDPSIGELLALETQTNLNSREKLKAFASLLDRLREQTHQFIDQARKEGKTIGGFGAARSGTTLIAQLDIADSIEYLFDNHPDKVGRYSAGYGIEVFPTDQIAKKKPDYLFILAWVHAKKIMESNRDFVEAGGKWVTCVPELEVTPS